MAITKEQITFEAGKGIARTDQIDFETGQGTLFCEQIVLTLVPIGIVSATQIKILDRNENLKKIVEVVSLVEYFRISGERYIQATLTKLPDNFANGWYIYTIPLTNIIWSNANKWRVEKFYKVDSPTGPRYEIHAEHIFCELLDESKENFELTNSTAINAITQALSGTNWEVGGVDVSGNYDLKIERHLSVLDILKRISKRWAGELQFRNDRKINFRTQVGSDNGLWFRYDKNIKNIDAEYNSQGLITRLYPYGKEELDISSVNAGVKYLDSAYIGDYPRPKIGTIYTQHSDAQKLKDYALNHLSTVETSRIMYRLNIADLSVLTKYSAEKFEMGDVVTVFDKELDIKVSTRINEIRRDYCYPENSQISLENSPKMLTDFIKELQELQDDYTPAPSEDTGPLPSAELPICFVIYVGGVLEAGIYQGAIIWVHTHCHAVEIMAYSKWKPTISDVVVGLAHNGTRVDEVTIPYGEYVAPGEGEVGAGGTTSINLPLAPFDRLNIDIDAADGVAQGLIVEIRCEK